MLQLRPVRLGYMTRPASTSGGAPPSLFPALPARRCAAPAREPGRGQTLAVHHVRAALPCRLQPTPPSCDLAGLARRCRLHACRRRPRRMCQEERRSRRVRRPRPLQQGADQQQYQHGAPLFSILDMFLLIKHIQVASASCYHPEKLKLSPREAEVLSGFSVRCRRGELHGRVRKMLITEDLTTKRKRTREHKAHLIVNRDASKEGAPMPGSICSDTVSEAGYDNMSKSGDSLLCEFNHRFASVLHQCVVSVASFIEGTMIFGCTGIFIPPGSDADPTSVLTSASLVRSSDDENKIIDNLTIKVRLPDDLVVVGWLHHYDLKYDIAVVNIERLHGFCAPKISYRLPLQYESTNVVAVRRCFDSGVLTTTQGIDIGRLSDELCELDMASIGDPIFGFNGSFAGMNCREGKRAVFLPRDKIIECLEHFGFRTDINQGGCGTKKLVTREIERHTTLGIARYDYPVPDKISRRGDFFAMCVYNSFEDKFEGDIWSTPNKELGSTLSECVVALASFNEGARHFACTGVFIDCYPARILTSASLVRSSDDKSKIYDNLRIEVCLQNRSRVLATLKHYDLCYNVAVVNIICFRSPRAIEL